MQINPKTKLSDVQIVIIDDNLPDNDPILALLKRIYKDVELKSSHEEGLKLIEAGLNKKQIVVLDYDLGDPHFNGHDMLLAIRKHSFLIPVILFTAHIDKLGDVPDFINNKTYGLAAKSDSKAVIALVKKAEITINTSIQGAIEEFISLHNSRKLNEPYLITANGTQYSLKQILEEIRLQTAFGKEFEKDLLSLTIDLLLRNKASIK
jgi:DNA-binding NtrC family response regulator